MSTSDNNPSYQGFSLPSARAGARAVRGFFLRNVFGGIAVWLLTWAVLYFMERRLGDHRFLHSLVDFWDNAPPSILVATFFALLTWAVQLLYVLHRVEHAAQQLESTLPQDAQKQIGDFLSASAPSIVAHSMLGIVASKGVSKEWAPHSLAGLGRGFLEVVTSKPDALAPALAQIAWKHIDKLRDDYGRLTSDEHDLEIPGRMQVDISAAFASHCSNSITFVDRAVYDQPQARWSAAFKTFLADLAKHSVQKVQFLIVPTGVDHNDPRVSTYKSTVEASGFQVVIVDEGELQKEVGDNISQHRFELFDNKVFIQIVRKPQFDEVGTVSITVKEVVEDAGVRDVMRSLMDLANHNTRRAT